MRSTSLQRRGAGHASLLHVLAAVPGAALRALVARMPEALWRALLGICGAILLLTPLLLWVSWSRSGYLTILASAAVALGIAYLLVHHAPEHRQL